MMYRKEIKVLDCTIRDGGLVNDHQFDMDFTRDVYKSLCAAGVDYIELGYKNSRELFDATKYGPWKFCDDDDLWRVIDGVETNSKVSVMADVGRVDMENIKECKDSPFDLVRVATYAKDVDKAIEMLNQFDAQGYETCINVMAVSRDQGPELEEALCQINEECKAQAVYIVDSFGALYQEPIARLTKLFKEKCPTKEVGIHAHNNQQLGFSNTIEAIINGANYLDATVYGMGRAAGNCPMELLIGFLKNPKYDLRPVLDLIANRFIKLREEFEWGYVIPFAIAGIMNDHPRDAMALRNSENKDNFKEFYEKLSTTAG